METWYKIGILFLALEVGDALNNGLVKVPPMGWLSWERFACAVNCNHDNELADCISEKLFVQIGDALIRKGYRNAGYDRVNIDDCWMSSARDVETGQLLPDPIRFPNGIKYLADHMHRNGLKLGIYQNLGVKTCMGYPGLLTHQQTDADTFAKWKVDMLKLDGCFTPTTKLDRRYAEFGRMLRKNRPIVYSCSWPYYQVFASKTHIIPNWNLISMNCNLFRVYHDIHANWKSILATIDFMADNQEIFRRITGPGSWPDPDMLLIGNPGLSVDKSMAQMAIWCILPAPLFMSNDPRTIGAKFEKILLNRKAISINQDSLAIPGERIYHNISSVDIFRRELSGKSMALVFLNRHPQSRNVKVKLTDILLPKLRNVDSFQMTNVFEDAAIARVVKLDSDLDLLVPGTGVQFLHFAPKI